MSQNWQNPQSFPQPWQRLTTGYVGGVCAGLGERFQIDPVVLRILWIALVLCAGTGIFFYLALWIALPVKGDNGAISRPVFLGVCSRIAQKYYWDIGLTRFGFITSTAFSFGLTLLAYFIVYFFLPPKNTEKVIYK